MLAAYKSSALIFQLVIIKTRKEFLQVIGVVVQPGLAYYLILLIKHGDLEMDMIVVFAPIVMSDKMSMDKETLTNQLKEALTRVLPQSEIQVRNSSAVQPVSKSRNCPLLSPRENEVLSLISKGFNQKETARFLELSPATVGGYKKEIYRKLGVSSVAEATLEAIRYGLIE